MQQEMITVYFDGKQYEVPSDLTIMTAMEYAGYRLVRGCGCRHGFCGACATIYRVEGKSAVKFVLACQTQVEDQMYVASLPFYPMNKKTYKLEELDPKEQLMPRFYPEIFACIGCNSCTKSCSRGLNVMQYIAYAKRGDLERCAHESFDCVSCGICSARCPANISHPMVGLLARRITGKYLTKNSQHNEARVNDINDGEYDAFIEEIMSKTEDELRQLYNAREIEK